MEELTRAEERIMLIFWRLKKGFVKDIIAEMPDSENIPYNTVSSVVRILESKGFLSYKAYGKTHEYFPVIKKNEYRKNQLKKMLSGYFSDSPSVLLSNLVQDENLSKDEINKLKDIINTLD
jgi:BlaI family penicillinase repressor